MLPGGGGAAGGFFKYFDFDKPGIVFPKFKSLRCEHFIIEILMPQGWAE